MNESIAIQQTHSVTLMNSEQSSDGELLRRFRETQEADAFARIVDRFAPLVLGIAAQSLRNRHTAEDVFQATFLVLARDASKIRNPESLAAWLYGTAMRISKRANSETHTSLSVEDVEVISPQLSPFELIHERFQQQVIHEELQRLPERYRSVLVLHIVEGKTCEQTAVALGTTVGAVRGCLQRGKREFKMRLIRRGIQATCGTAAVGFSQSVAEASIRTPLATSTVQGGLAHISGASAAPWCSIHATQLAAMETVMYSSFIKVLTTSGLVAAAVMIGLFAGSATAKTSDPQAILSSITVAVDEPGDRETAQFSAPVAVAKSMTLVALQTEGRGDEQDKPAARPPLVAKYGDDKADGKKSIAGTGEIIQFTLPNETQKLRGLKLHCARYGYPRAPKENVRMTIVDENGGTVHTEAVPYSTFKRGECKWTNVRLKEVVKVPKTFSVIVEFNAERTKGVYLSYDTSTGGKYSRTGVPGGEARAVNFKGDWMIQAMLTSPD